jgi:hypothetical protein
MQANRVQFRRTARCDIHAIDHNAARVGFHQPKHLLQQSCLAGAAPAQKHENFATLNVEADAVQNTSGAVRDTHFTHANNRIELCTGIFHPAALHPIM